MSALSLAQVAELRQRITEHGLDAAADYIVEQAVPCYAIVADGCDEYTEVGNSRFGGTPDLPHGYAWPCSGAPDDAGTCFSNFIAQINFAEVPHLAAPSGLPSSGILYLFVRAMAGASEPVQIDALFYDGTPAALRRGDAPPAERLCDEYLIDLQPQRVTVVPAISLPRYRKDFQATLERVGGTVDGVGGADRGYELERALLPEGAIGQMLGYANAPDISENLYRRVHLTQMGERHLVFSDYWDSIEEYEAYIQEWQARGDMRFVEEYKGMRKDVTWLVAHAEEIAAGSAAWQLLLRVDSNAAMDLWINDADPLYVFIPAEALARCAFSHLVGEVTQG